MSRKMTSSSLHACALGVSCHQGTRPVLSIMRLCLQASVSVSLAIGNVSCGPKRDRTIQTLAFVPKVKDQVEAHYQALSADKRPTLDTMDRAKFAAKHQVWQSMFKQLVAASEAGGTMRQTLNILQAWLQCPALLACNCTSFNMRASDGDMLTGA